MKEGENDMNWCLPQSCYITPHECLITRTVMPLGIFKYLQMYMFGGLFNVISTSVSVVSILKANKEAKRLSLYCGAPHQQNTDENKNAITTEAGQLLKSGRSFSQGLLMFKLRRKKKIRRTEVLGCMLVLGKETERMEKQRSGTNAGGIMTMREG